MVAYKAHFLLDTKQANLTRKVGRAKRKVRCGLEKLWQYQPFLTIFYLTFFFRDHRVKWYQSSSIV